MIEIVIFFLVVSVTLYTIFGGADFGAGILELFCKKEMRETQREVVTKAIAPVWEANHIWIILVIVILFNAFPEAYSSISTIFHIPLTLMLFGIVLRGCAFTFRHYDAFRDSSHELYSRIFSASSLLTPLFQGVIAGGLILGKVSSEPKSFTEAYINPWFNLFSFSVGLFLCSLCAFVAAVFLVSEYKETKLKDFFIRRVYRSGFISLVMGAFVFACAEFSNFDLLQLFLSNTLSLICFITASIAMAILFICIGKYQNIPRILITAIVTLILVGWWSVQFPYLIGIAGESKHSLSLYEIAAPPAVLKQLVIALVAGCFLIFPALFFLIKTFKFKAKE